MKHLKQIIDWSQEAHSCYWEFKEDFMCKLNDVEKELEVREGELDNYIDGEPELAENEEVHAAPNRGERRKTDRRKARSRITGLHRDLTVEPIGKFVNGVPTSQRKKKLIVETELTPAKADLVKIEALDYQEDGNEDQENFYNILSTCGEIGKGYEDENSRCEIEDCLGTQYRVIWPDEEVTIVCGCGLNWIDENTAKII